MIELAVFLAFQALANFLVWRFARVSYPHRKPAFLGYSVLLVLLFIYAQIKLFHYHYPYIARTVKFAGIRLGLTDFLWIVGVPIVLITQGLFHYFLFNRLPKKPKI